MVTGSERGGQVVVITGASSGIGRAAALELARGGARLALAARREPALESLARECGTLGGAAIAVPTDVTDELRIERLAQRAVEAFGRIDAWVNNAGVLAYGRFEELPPEVFRRVLEVNFFGAVYGARAAIHRFREQGEGVLVNVASIFGTAAGAYQSPYIASKHALVGLSAALRQELIDEPRIRVATILPATMDTPIFRSAANYVGLAPRPPEPVHDPRRVARAIVEAIRRPAGEVFVGSPGSVLPLVRRLAPDAYVRIAERYVRARNFTDEPAVGSTGNLFEPGPDGASVDGGWGTTVPAGVDRLVPVATGLAAITLVSVLGRALLERGAGRRTSGVRGGR